MSKDGSLVLEILNEAGFLDSFYEAVDSDDFEAAKRVMTNAGIDQESIEKVLNEMRDNDISIINDECC